MAMKLNPNHEKFCLEYSASGNATDAYLKAYGTENERTAASNANKLLRKTDIQNRLRELADELKQKKIAGVVECQELLTEIARNAEADDANRIKAIQILLKVQGAFVTQINFNSVPVVISGGDQLED